MKYVVVLPYVFQRYLDACVATMHPEFKRNVLFVDNTLSNVGIMRAHNMGIDRMKELRADWLVILSAAVRFGPAGGLDFIEQLRVHPDHHVIHAASENVVGGKQADPNGGGGHNEIFGWHLTAFHRSVFETIGRFDENFTPYGFDDIDLSLRIRKGIPGVKWDTYSCDVHDTTMSHSIKLAGVESPSAPRMLYFMEKWGRHPGAWQWDGWEHPFNNPEHSLAYWPPAPNGGKWND